MKELIYQALRGLYHISLSPLLYHYRLYKYWRTLPRKVRAIQNKNEIKVLFVISGIRQWKGKYLFQQMLLHPRFRPIIGRSYNSKYPRDKEDVNVFLSENDYEFVDLDNLPNGIDDVEPDLIIYNSPYSSGCSEGLYFDKNLKYVFCGVDYTIHITKLAAHMDHPWYDYCWQFYVEHPDVAKAKKKALGYRARNIKVTGVPTQDELMLPKDFFIDPWKDKNGKKRIIYAPHHSLKGTNGEGVEYSTFLDYCEDIYQLALKYRDYVTIVFKPHPFLYIKLKDIWGKEKTDAYYERWCKTDNTQFVDGEYLGLFKHSDAIIHDCASFIIEYLYMNNPSMYLVSSTNHIEDMFDYVQEGFNCHEHGYSIDDIEAFIQNVISGIDYKKEQREKYIINQLTPPNGRRACDNIMDAILGE